jgi:quinol monooxygenase YgiN
MSSKSDERHLVVEFNCVPESRAEVERLLREFIEPARQEDGCLYYDLYTSVDDPNRFYILDGWRDQACVDRHGEHPNVVRVVQQLLPLLSKPVDIAANIRLSD